MSVYLGKCTESTCPWINQLGGCSLTACIRDSAVMMPSMSTGTIKLKPNDIDLLNEIYELRADRDYWKAEAIKATAELGEMKIADEQGLLLRLPDIKLYKTLYWIWGNEIMPVKYMGISHGCVDKHKKFHVVCRMHTKKDRTFTSGKKVITYKAGDKRFFYHDDIGKTVFLTREAAEEALRGGEGE